MGNARLGAIAIDCHDPIALADFYKAVLDLPVALSTDELFVLQGAGALLVRTLLEHAIDTGRIPAQPVETTALMMLGAIREATLYVARATDHDKARHDARLVVDRLINALSAD